MSKKHSLTKEQAIEELWKRGTLDFKLSTVQKTMKSEVMEDKNKISVVLSSRRLGKCIAEGTEVITTKGIKKIEHLTEEDYVYGYDSKGNVSPTKVTFWKYQGEKEVVDLVHHNKVMATCTPEHRWLTYDPRSKKESVKRVKDFKYDTKIRREFVESPCGDIHVEHAYSIGALLGDGCSRENRRDICISSEDDRIPQRVAKELGATHLFRQNEKNYTWCISNYGKGKAPSYRKHYNKVECSFYDEWCKNKYAYEKLIDLDEVKNWNRESCLNLLAGLLDTDGSVGVTKYNNLHIQFHSQSKSLVDCFSFLIRQLFLVEGNIYEDNREKYKNGKVYTYSLKNNIFCKRVLKRLSPYLTLDRKKYKEEYDSLKSSGTVEDYLGVKICNPRKVKTYDIQIDNDTHLYLLANGMVTHNTWLLCVLALEQCLKKPHSIVKFVFPKQKDAKTNIKPLMREITEDCPESIKPYYKEQDKMFEFPNGSQIQLAGSDNGNIDSIRGGRADLCLVDEAGFVDDLKYGIRSVLSPTTKTTKGRIIMASTPSRDPNHEFITEFVHPYMAEGRIKIYTIHDNPNFDEEIIRETIEEYPLGEDDPDFKREYLCELSERADQMVIPELTPEAEKDVFVDHIDIPPFYDAYVSMDIGFVDLTVALFGYYDFKQATLVILDELVIEGMNTEQLANGILEKERELFKDPMTGFSNTPYLRVCDNNLIVINDLQKLHGINVVPTAKDKKEAAINSFRITVSNKKLKIHNRCKTLKYHLKMAEWNNRRNDFKRIKDSVDGSIKGGHADCLDAVLYMHRNVITSKNPYPIGYDQLTGENVHQSVHEQEDKKGAKSFMKAILNIK